MPNFDGGHYFLTVFAPVKTGVVEQDDPSNRSHEQLLRKTLAELPPAQQTRIRAESGKNSPFSRNKRTHLARFAVLDDVTYNGRIATDAILNRDSRIIPQHIDSLNCPYLLFAADFDAATAGEAELDSYLDELWQTMEPELRSIFQHCVGFENVSTPGSFIHYIKQCQIETTMPFNDYWRGAPPLKGLQLRPMLKKFALLAVIGFAAPWVIDFFAGSVDWSTWFKVTASVVLVLLVVVLAIVTALSALMRAGNKPFPTAPDSDLKSVLKALYLQQKFSDFAIQNQGVDDTALQTNFGAFLDDHKPGDLDNPTQQPGVIDSRNGETS